MATTRNWRHVASTDEMLQAIQKQVELRTKYLKDKNIDFTTQFFLDKFEPVAQCKIADITDPENAIASLEKTKPCLIMTHCDVTTFVPKQEVYLVHIHVLGTVKEVLDDEDTCKIEIIAVGLDDNDERTPPTDILDWKMLADIKKQWDQMPSVAKKNILTECLGVDTAVAVYKGTFEPRDYASDTRAIKNRDLLHVLHDAPGFYSKLCGDPRKSTFQYERINLLGVLILIREGHSL